MTESRQINGSAAKEIFEAMYDRDVQPHEYAEEKGLLMVKDEGLLAETVEKLPLRTILHPWRITLAAKRKPSASWWARP